MKFILAEDSFKGSLSSKEANDIVEQAVKKVFPESECKKLSIADGGEGTLEAVLGEENGNDYEIISCMVSDPMGKSIVGKYLKKEEKAIIEMASVSGITLVEQNKKDIFKATSLGTGQLIRHALEHGCTDIYIGIGGSATNDGGTGAMTALGIRFLDEEKNELTGNGENLLKITEIDDSEMLPFVKSATFTIMCDVTNPLTGPNGATYIYGPQKGGTKDDLTKLEAGMEQYQAVLEQYTGENLADKPSFGAAGGMGAALYVFLHATMRSGIDVLLDLNGFDEYLSKDTLVITGEGKTDHQSACGKVIYGIAKRCQPYKVPVFVLSGSLSGNLEELYQIGISGMESCVCQVMELEEAMEHASQYLYDAAIRMLLTYKCGRNQDKE